MAEKTSVNASNVNLPFPYPMLSADKQKIWPFKEEGFALLYGTLDHSEKFIIVKDDAAIFTLLKMGFFGFNSNKEINHFYEMENLNDGKRNKKVKANFKLGFYSLNTTDIPMACTEFEHDANRSNSKAPVSGSSSPTSLTSLKLCLEEAYFLAYVFGLLTITKENDVAAAYNLKELWSSFCHLYDANNCLQFAARYAAYHFFRSKGWIVRNSFKFGTDYLLYKEGPPFFHALYSVVIVSQVEGEPNKQFHWNEVSGLTRVSKNARKELLICMVTIPKAFTSAKVITSPECIQHFTVDLLHVNRWNSSKGEFDSTKIFYS